MGLNEQFEFTFSPQEKAANESTLENLTDDEVMARYTEAVGINPKFRGFNRETLLTGLADPEAERDRLRALDSEEDKRELKKPYVQ